MAQQVRDRLRALQTAPPTLTGGALTRWRRACRYKLISGDDKFMTRWIVKHNWNMAMQVSPECTLATTFKADGKFFMQILRWTRNTWRSDFKSLVLERDIWYRYPVQARPPPPSSWVWCILCACVCRV